MTGQPSSRIIARRLLSRRLSLFPIPRPRPGVPRGCVGDGKVPAIAWREFQTRWPTHAELDAWFRTDTNIGIVCGTISGVVVIDLDGLEAFAWARRHLPRTPWMTLTAKGMHLWFRHPGGTVANRTRIAKLPIDLRSDGGFVVAPGSVHASGHVYRCAGDWRLPRAALPIFQPSWLPTPPIEHVPARAVTKGKGAGVDALTRARAYLARVPLPEIGQGSDHATFVAAAHLVRGFALSAADAEHVLWSWAGGRPGWTRAWITQKVTSAEKHGKEAIGALL